MAFNVGDKVSIDPEFLEAGDYQADLESALADREVNASDMDAIDDAIENHQPLEVLAIEEERGDDEEDVIVRYVIGLNKGAKKIKAYSAFTEDELLPYTPPENAEEMVEVTVYEEITYTFQLTRKEFEAAKANPHGLDDWFCNLDNPVGRAKQFAVNNREITTPENEE